MSDSVEQQAPGEAPSNDESPKFRYTAALANELERRWQDHWEAERTFEAPNPAGPMAEPEKVAGREKLFVMDMFPYPSGSGLHVGHPLGYIATDVFGRYKRMTGYNVLHSWDTTPSACPPSSTRCRPGSTRGSPPSPTSRTCAGSCARWGWPTTRAGRSSTTDTDYYRWTQWIFLRSSTPGTTPTSSRAPHAERRAVAARAGRSDGRAGTSPSGVDADAYRDSKRLAYLAEVPVNWCPELGTVLANEEIVDGRSERGGHPVVRMPLKQWMMRITAYADRLIDDLDTWTGPIRSRLCNATGSGRSEGRGWILSRQTVRRSGGPHRRCSRPGLTRSSARPTWCSPERRHPLVDRLTTRDRREAVATYRGRVGGEVGPRPDGPGQDQDRGVHRRLCREPRQRRGSPSGWPTTS